MQVQEAFQALADPTRRQILRLLGDKELSAGEVANEFEMSWPSVSRHLGVLRTAALIVSRREGSNIVYSLNSDSLEQLATQVARLNRGAKKFRVVTSRIGLTGYDPLHPQDRAHYLLIQALPEDRYEIVTMPPVRYRRADQAADEIVLENPDAVGLSVGNESHLLVPEVTQLLRTAGVADVPIFVSGDYPADAIPKFKESGVSGFLFDDFKQESIGGFARWLEAALNARESQRTLERQLLDSYAIGNFAGAIHPDVATWFKEEKADSEAIRAYIEQELKGRVTLQRVDVEREGKTLRVTIHTPQPGRVLGRSGATSKRLYGGLVELTGKKAIVLNVVAAKNTRRAARV